MVDDDSGDDVEMLLLSFDGNSASIRRAILRAARAVPPDSPVRGRMDIFTGNLGFAETMILAGDAPEQWRAVLLAEWRDLAAQISAARVYH